MSVFEDSNRSRSLEVSFLRPIAVTRFYASACILGCVRPNESSQASCGRMNGDQVSRQRVGFDTGADRSSFWDALTGCWSLQSSRSKYSS